MSGLRGRSARMRAKLTACRSHAERTGSIRACEPNLLSIPQGELLLGRSPHMRGKPKKQFARFGPFQIVSRLQFFSESSLHKAL